jgi:putative glutamine amidotransferase
MKGDMNDYKPIILINLCTRSTDDMFYIRRGYLEAIKNAGGVPVALPLMADRDYAQRVIELADGILLPGSLTDVDPKYYGSSISPYYGESGPERDESDFYLLEKAAERKMPVFGICFGHQSLNVFNGGSLYQDIPHDLNSNVTHWQGEPYHLPAHTVKVEEGSIIYKIFGKNEIEVNSIHHQGVKTIAPNLRPTSYSPDGVIESYENRNGGQFLMGVQWHPERMWRESPPQAALFQEFISAANQWHQKNR